MSHDHEKLAAKRAAVMGGGSGKHRLPLVLAILAFAAAAAAGWATLASTAQPPPAAPASGAMFTYAPQAGAVTHALADFAPGEVKFFQHKTTGGALVRYFVHVDRAGNAHAALDACGACWQAGKGHRHEGDRLICQNCRKAFPLTQLGAPHEIGACAPIDLAATIVDGNVSLRIEALNGGAKYFPAGQGG